MAENETGASEDATSIRTIEEFCEMFRGDIEAMKCQVVALLYHREFKEEDSMLEGAHIPCNCHGVMCANITLAFRHLEDARMRLGKVMQACQGGISKFDKPKTGEPQ